MTQRSVVTLCGSVRFKDEFMREDERLTKQGHIVLKPGCWDYLGDDVEGSERELKAFLIVLHLKKIRMSDRIHIINRNGYTGNQTVAEIAYASDLGLEITYMVSQGEE